MDELQITSKLMRGLISKALASFIFKKTGYKVDVDLIELNAVVSDGRAHIHLNVDADMDADEFKKFERVIR